MLPVQNIDNKLSSSARCPGKKANTATMVRRARLEGPRTASATNWPHRGGGTVGYWTKSGGAKCRERAKSLSP